VSLYTLVLPTAVSYSYGHTLWLLKKRKGNNSWSRGPFCSQCTKFVVGQLRAFTLEPGVHLIDSQRRTHFSMVHGDSSIFFGTSLSTLLTESPRLSFFRINSVIFIHFFLFSFSFFKLTQYFFGILLLTLGKQPFETHGESAHLMGMIEKEDTDIVQSMWGYKLTLDPGQEHRGPLDWPMEFREVVKED
jgi:hypothetical protein